MDWLLLVLSGGAVVVGGRLLWARRRAHRSDEAHIEVIRTLAGEDVTLLGEELARLDAEVARLDEDGREDYQRALDAYEVAQRAAPRIRTSDDITEVTDALDRGRYATACVRSRLAGAPPPEYRVPCFFNPQHGPSVADVRWTRSGRGTKTVPACAQDAARIRNQEKPEIRTATIDGLRVPYWEVRTASVGYGQGSFVGADVAAGGASVAWAFESSPVEHGWHGDFGDGGFGDGGFGDGGFGDGGGGGGDGGGV
ncbi:MAG: hypothetical protein WBQ50_05500 [Nocardioides sp.]